MKEVILKLFKNKNNKQTIACFPRKSLPDSIKRILDTKKTIKIRMEDK